MIPESRRAGNLRRARGWAATLVGLAGCSRLAEIPHDPPQTPESWLLIQPYVQVPLGSRELILTQPSSSVLVYALGLITVGAGLYLLRIRSLHRARAWWGIALLLWGFGALAAGTSYQAFSYAIKCTGRAFCSWTSWWEIVYLVFSGMSVDAMTAGWVLGALTGRWRRRTLVYAGLHACLYVMIIFWGVFTLSEILISFEMLVLVSAPNLIGLLVLNSWAWRKFHHPLDRALVVVWIWLGLTTGAYYLYLRSGLTQILWERGIWFSENDVLHIGLIGLMLFIIWRVIPYIGRTEE